MSAVPDSLAPMAEGHARVVAVEGGRAWLQAEAPAACGGCASKGGCGSASAAKRTGRFAVVDDFHARVGDRVVVGVEQGALTRATAVVYVLPLAGLLAGALVGAGLGGGDAVAAGGAAAGFLAGMGVARLAAGRMTRLGGLAPKVLRRAGDEACPGDGEP